MKVALTTWLFVLLSSCSLKAQTTFGIKGGPNFSYMSIQDGVDYSFHAGAYSEIALSDIYFIRPELLYSEKGTMPTLLSSYQLECTFVYLSMPVLVGRNVTDHLAILAGPEINYLLDGRSYTYDDQIFISSDVYTSWDVALDFGMAYRISSRFSAELRYSLGVVDVVDIMFRDGFDRPVGSLEEGKNRTLQLSVSYLLATRDSKVMR